MAKVKASITVRYFGCVGVDGKSYVVESTKNTTDPAPGDRLSKAEVDELIGVCKVDVTIMRPKAQS